MRDTTDWLLDALRSGRRAVELAAPLTYEQYHSTEFPRIGIERYLIIVGDALNPVLHHEPTLAEVIPDARAAIDLRNFLTHAYMHIDDLVVWNVLTEHMPRLLADIESILRERGSLPGDDQA